MKRQLALTTALLTLTLAAAWAQQTALATKGAPLEGADRTTDIVPNSDKHPISGAGLSYVISAEDMLYIAVWKEPDLTITVPVRSDGMISLPLVNDVPAAGLTPMQLAGVLTEQLKKYLAAPRVTVVVTQIKPQRVYVLGEVLHTGPISLLPNMTVLQALATAGLSPFANTKGIYLLRTDRGQQQKIAFNYRHVIKGADIAQNIPLKPGDTIVVP
jgi:polysaccharide export outer membrane protein